MRFSIMPDNHQTLSASKFIVGVIICLRGVSSLGGGGGLAEVDSSSPTLHVHIQSHAQMAMLTTFLGVT